MRIETKQVFVAFDDKEFDSEHECRTYEREKSGARLVGLTQADIDKALAGEDAELGDAIEAMASKIRARRLAAGGSKRPRKMKGAAPQEPQSAEPTTVFATYAEATQQRDAA